MTRSKKENKYCSICGRSLSVSDSDPYVCDKCKKDNEKETIKDNTKK